MENKLFIKHLVSFYSPQEAFFVFFPDAVQLLDRVGASSSEPAGSIDDFRLDFFLNMDLLEVSGMRLCADKQQKSLTLEV